MRFESVPTFPNSGRKQRPLRALLVVMDLDLRYDENSSSPYMERVQRAQLGPVRFESVPTPPNSGRKQRPLRALLVVMDLDLRYDENSSSPYMERASATSAIRASAVRICPYIPLIPVVYGASNVHYGLCWS